MIRKRINKDKIKLTFGSDSRDDEFYIELRESQKDIYSFLSFATIDDDIEVYIGKGVDAVIINLSDLELIIKESKEKLIKAKVDWNRTLDDKPDWD